MNLSGRSDSRVSGGSVALCGATAGGHGKTLTSNFLEFRCYNFGFLNPFTTFSDGCLGSNIDEGRSKMRYAPWMAEFRESRECWTHTALLGYSWEYVYFRTRTLKCFQGNLWNLSIELPAECVVVCQCIELLLHWRMKFRIFSNQNLACAWCCFNYSSVELKWFAKKFQKLFVRVISPIVAFRMKLDKATRWI